MSGPIPDPGDVTARLEAYTKSIPAPVARAPDGPTHTTIGTVERKIVRAMESASTFIAPGVLSCNTTVEPSRSASAMVPSR